MFFAPDRWEEHEAAAVFQQLTSTLKRIGGRIGNIMTAASAAVVFDGIVNDTEIITHAVLLLP